MPPHMPSEASPIASVRPPETGIRQSGTCGQSLSKCSPFNAGVNPLTRLLIIAIVAYSLTGEAAAPLGDPHRRRKDRTGGPLLDGPPGPRIGQGRNLRQ